MLHHPGFPSGEGHQSHHQQIPFQSRSHQGFSDRQLCLPSLQVSLGNWLFLKGNPNFGPGGRYANVFIHQFDIFIGYETSLCLKGFVETRCRCSAKFGTSSMECTKNLILKISTRNTHKSIVEVHWPLRKKALKVGVIRVTKNHITIQSHGSNLKAGVANGLVWIPIKSSLLTFKWPIGTRVSTNNPSKYLG